MSRRTWLPLLIVIAGAAMATAGLTWWFGPPALVACGALVVVAGLLFPEEALDGQPAETPPRP